MDRLALAAPPFPPKYRSYAAIGISGPSKHGDPAGRALVGQGIEVEVGPLRNLLRLVRTPLGLAEAVLRQVAEGIRPMRVQVVRRLAGVVVRLGILRAAVVAERVQPGGHAVLLFLAALLLVEHARPELV